MPEINYEQEAQACAKRQLTKAAASELMTIVNETIFNPKQLVEELATHHRTLQQGLTRLVVEWIEYLADLKDGEYDGRNQASVELAKQIVATGEWKKRKYLPHI